MHPLDLTVIDADTMRPIENAKVVYVACDVHDSRCEHAGLVRTSSSKTGAVKIPGRREWGPWGPAPGALPVPNHFIAIWADGYSAYAYGQYGDTVESRKRGITRTDILDALNTIPNDRSSSDASLNPTRELDGGKVRLRKLQQ
jgi:hypothetical protein